MKKIKFFMCCHKPYDYLPPLAVAVQGGRALNAAVEGAIGDDTGDNISEKNREYCELTVQYYAWRNEESDYYGFVHYRRFFSFKPKLTRRPYIPLGVFGSEDEAKYIGSEDEIRSAIEGCNIAVVRSEDMGQSVREHYASVKNQFASDLELFEKIIERKAPELLPFADEYLLGTRQYFCNMFVMDRDTFFEYCELLFGLLSEFDREKTLHGDFQQDRTDGYLAERFLGMFILMKKSLGATVREFPRIDTSCSVGKRLFYRILPPESRLRFFFKKLAKGR